MSLDLETIRALPKVALHDHLDGGPRPGTLVELAQEVGHTLPTSDPDELGRWFFDAASSGSLERFLTTFDHVLPMMQRAEHLQRIAREAVADLAADGVVAAEQRYAPEQHLQGGLTPQQVVDAVQAGLEEGMAEAAAAGRPIRVGQIVTALRHGSAAEWTADLALANRDRGVVGFDVAGAEAGCALAPHVPALHRLRQASFPVTIHAGEAAGLDSIADALHLGLAQRIGHGMRVADDVTLGEASEEDPWGLAGARLGLVAHWVRDTQTTLELCPTSNVQTGAVGSIAEHPITVLNALGFAVTVSSDNRLMCGTSTSEELYHLVTQAHWTLEDVRDATVTAAWSLFRHQDERAALVEEIIEPAYAAAVGGSGRHRA